MSRASALNTARHLLRAKAHNAFLSPACLNLFDPPPDPLARRRSHLVLPQQPHHQQVSDNLPRHTGRGPKPYHGRWRQINLLEARYWATMAAGLGFSSAACAWLGAAGGLSRSVVCREQRVARVRRVDGLRMTLEMVPGPSGELNWVSGPGSRRRHYDFDPQDIERVKLRHVLVETEELALSLMAAIKNNESTLEEMSEMSIDAETKHNKGDLGWCRRGDVHLGPELEAVVFNYRVNDVNVLQTSRGWHIIKVEDSLHRLKPAMNYRDPYLMKKKNASSRVNKSDMQRVENTYAVTTMGCQMNMADSEKMASELKRLGFEEIEDPNLASVVVFNTCSIRDHAEQKVYSYLGNHARRKWLYPDIKLVVAGCVAQQEGEKLLRRVPELDLVMGPQYSNRLGELLEQVSAGNQVAATEPIHIMEDISKPRRDSSVTAWVNIIYGCNERCTYCVVPNTRGLEQSRPREAIKKEIASLAAEGYREVVLLGQNIDAYGRDLSPKDSFAKLLGYIHDVPGLERIRFTTSHPRYMSESLVDTCADLPKVMPHFHFPFQSGDNTVLKGMGRGYTVETYKRIANRIRAKIPDASIAADAIVGFPGETEEQFQNTLDLMEEMKFDQVNTAAYSPRPHTPAASWSSQLSEDEKDDRLQRINRQNTKDALERSQRYLGRIERVLVEEQNPKIATQVMGRTPTNKLTYLEGNIEELRGKFVDVRIVEIFAFSVRGEIIEECIPY